MRGTRAAAGRAAERPADRRARCRSPPGSASPASAPACSLIGLTRSTRESGSRRHALAYALANAAIIAAYTIVDGLGVRALGQRAAATSRCCSCSTACPTSRSSCGSAARALARVVRLHARRWPVALARLRRLARRLRIALWAMTRAPVASVAALRETSVLFAALIGVLHAEGALPLAARARHRRDRRAA